MNEGEHLVAAGETNVKEDRDCGRFGRNAPTSFDFYEALWHWRRFHYGAIAWPRGDGERLLAVEKGKMKRELRLEALREKPEVSVLIIGGGVNGIGTFRDLALQGVDALLVERGDFCSGTSAGSSHMLHGGLRYLENGEFRLVNEALHERDRLLDNAPHYAKPLRTTIPSFAGFPAR